MINKGCAYDDWVGKLDKLANEMGVDMRAVQAISIDLVDFDGRKRMVELPPDKQYLSRGSLCFDRGNVRPLWHATRASIRAGAGARQDSTRHHIPRGKLTRRDGCALVANVEVPGDNASAAGGIIRRSSTKADRHDCRDDYREAG